MATRERERVDDPSGWSIAPDEKAVARYFELRPLPVRLIARELDGLARASLPKVSVGMKWSVPFYSLRGPVCYISAAAKHVTFGLVQGADIPDDSGRLTGTGKSPIRKSVFRVGEPVPRTLVRAWLKEAKMLDKTWGEH